MTRTRTRLAFLAASAALAAVPLAVSAPASAAEGWLPDRVRVMALPAGLLTVGQADYLAALGDPAPGTVLDVEWSWDGTGDDGFPCEARGCAKVDGVVLPQTLRDTPVLTPAGPDSDTGATEYPAYNRLVETVDGVFLSEAFAGEPAQGGRPAAFPEGVFWASSETTTYGGETFVRVGQGISEAWVPAAHIVDAEVPAVDDSNGQAEPSESPESTGREPSQGAEEVDQTSTADNTGSDAGDGSGVRSAGLLAVVIAAAMALGLAAAAAVRRRRKSAAEDGEV